MSACRPVYAILLFIFHSRGKVGSGDEDDKENKCTACMAKGSKNAKEGAEAWRTKQAKKNNIAIKHKTYEEIVLAVGLEPSAVPACAGVGTIIDATGATL